MRAQEIHVGKLIKEVVRQSDYTLSDLARELGISRQTLNGWLNRDDMSVKNLFTISEILGYDFLKKFNLPSAKEQEAKIILQIEIEKDKQDEVLKFVHDKDLYNLLLKK